MIKSLHHFLALVFLYKDFYIYINMSKSSTKIKYYQKKQGQVSKQARERYQDLFGKKNNKKPKYQNLSEDENK